MDDIMGTGAKVCIGVIVIVVISILLILIYMSSQHSYELSEPHPQPMDTPDAPSVSVSIKNEFDSEIIINLTVNLETRHNISIGANSIEVYSFQPLGEEYTCNVEIEGRILSWGSIHDMEVYSYSVLHNPHLYVKIYEGDRFATTTDEYSGSIDLKAGQKTRIEVAEGQTLCCGDIIDYSWKTDDKYDELIFYIGCYHANGEDIQHYKEETYKASGAFRVPHNNTYHFYWENDNWIDTASIEYSYTITHTLNEKEIIVDCRNYPF